MTPPQRAGASGARLPAAATAHRSSTSSGRHAAAALAGRGGACRAGCARAGDFGQLRRLARAAGALARAQAARPAPRRRAAIFRRGGRRPLGLRAPCPRAQPPTQRTATRSSMSRARCSQRYGVVFWRLLEREAAWLPPWRDLLRVYRRLEGRGEIRGGRFVAGFSGEQYALPEAIGMLREIRRRPPRATGVVVRGRSAQPRRRPHAGAAASGADRQPGPLSRWHSRLRSLPAAKCAFSPRSRPVRNGTPARRCCAPAERSISSPTRRRAMRSRTIYRPCIEGIRVATR